MPLSRECSVCGDGVHARGLCGKHYQRWYVHGAPRCLQRPTLTGTKCYLPGCDGLHYGRGLCEAHYRRLHDRGSVLDKWGILEINR